MKKFLSGFVFAFQGIIYLVKNERNFKIHLIALSVVILLGFYFGIKITEWIAILIISALILSMEAVNSAIERMCDLYSKELNPTIKVIKDVSAGAVLIAALFSIVIAILIFYPYFKALL